MKKLNFYKFGWMLIPMLTLLSCKKDLNQLSSTVTVTNNLPNDGPIPPYLFNWETATTMPTASSSSTNPIPMPWNSGTTAIDPNIVSDYKSADGWVMVWNTFSPSVLPGDPNYIYFFSLYNVYRGLLRFYLWQPASAVATSYVNHGLSLYSTGGTSPMLDFDATDVVKTANQTTFSEMLNQQIASSQGTWFAFQYEITYDPNIANTSFPSFGLTWASQWAAVTSITLNGTQTGTIAGTISTPGSGFSFGSLITGVISFAGGLGYSTILGILANGNTNSTTNPYAAAFNSATGGIVKGFLSALLGFGTGGTTQNVSLTMDTQIKLAGNLVSNGALENVKLALPGQSNSQTADGNTPAYNNIMGVFNISNPPQMIRTFGGYDLPYVDEYDQQQDAGMTEMTIQYDPSSFNFVWNPAIINTSTTGAHIENLNIQTVQFTNYPNTDFISEYTAMAQNISPPTTGYPMLVAGTGTFERPPGPYTMAVGDYANDPLVIDYYNWGGGPCGIRVSFDVVPNNGATRGTIVKTFLAGNSSPY